MQQSAVHLAYAVNTTTVSWIGKSSVKEVMSLVMRKCVDGTKPGDFARIEHELQVNPLLTGTLYTKSMLPGILLN